MSEKTEEKMEENKINKFTCETIKIYNRLKNAAVDQNRKLFHGDGCVFSTEEIDKLDIENLDFYKINGDAQLIDFTGGVRKKITVDKKYDFVIAVCRRKFYIGSIEDIMSLIKPNGFLIFYCANPYYTIDDNYNQNIVTKIGSSEIMHDFLLRIKNIHTFDFEVIDAMSIPMKIPFVNCDLENNEYFYQVIIKVSNNLFGKKNLNDEAQLVNLDD